MQATVTATNAAGSNGASSAFTSSVTAQPLPSNPVTAENALPGSTAWESPDATGSAIEGYTSQISSAPGDTVSFHVSTSPAANYRVEIYRLGWYGGDGARLITCLPSCTTDEAGVGPDRTGAGRQRRGRCRVARDRLDDRASRAGRAATTSPA